MNAGRWWGGIIAALIAWVFAGVDTGAHRGVLDGFDVLLVAVGGLFFAIPRIDRLTASIPILGRSGVQLSVNELQRVATDATTVASQTGDTAEQAASLYERWLIELDTVLTMAERATPEEASRALFRFINTRLEDVAAWVGGADEETRAALWWWSAVDGGACIVAAPSISDRETLEYLFRPGEGLLGRVLLDGEPINIADAQAEAQWEHIAATAPRYHGLLCLPIVVRGRVAGVLTVDRVATEKFSSASVRFARQVATLIRVAAQHPSARGDLVALMRPIDTVLAPRKPLPGGEAPT